MSWRSEMVSKLERKLRPMPREGVEGDHRRERLVELRGVADAEDLGDVPVVLPVGRVPLVLEGTRHEEDPALCLVGGRDRARHAALGAQTEDRVGEIAFGEGGVHLGERGVEAALLVQQRDQAPDLLAQQQGGFLGLDGEDRHVEQPRLDLGVAVDVVELALERHDAGLLEGREVLLLGLEVRLGHLAAGLDGDVARARDGVGDDAEGVLGAGDVV